MKHWRALSLSALILPAIFLISCSSDDPLTDPGGGDDPDNTPPVVTQVGPIQGENGVGLNDNVVITFSEAMADRTEPSLVTLSNGTVTDVTWSNGHQTATIAHSAWTEGTLVTVTATTGFTDEAGNGLAEAFVWNFTTDTSALILTSSLPANGTTGVPINSQIVLTFSQPINDATVTSGITVSSPDKATHDYSHETEVDVVTLTLDADLPADTEITVAISTDLEAMGALPMETATDVVFTTGSEADSTPPEVLTFEPADGASISVNQSYVRMTFDEPIDDEHFQPSFMSGQFGIAMINPEEAGVWSENYTVLTIGLRTPLTPGAVFQVEFDSFRDIHGNVNDSGITWEGTVEGTAEYLPALDDWYYYYEGTWEEGPVFDEYELESTRWIEVVSSTDFRIWDYTEYYAPPGKVPMIPFEEYDLYRVTSGAIQFLGFHEVDGGEDIDVTFTPPVTWLPLPVSTGTWSGTSTFPMDEVTAQVDFSGEVLAGAVDIRYQPDETPGEMVVYWVDCRRVVLEYEIGDGDDVFSSGRDSLWLAPGMGMVRQVMTGTEDGTDYREIFDLQWAGPSEEASSFR